MPDHALPDHALPDHALSDIGRGLPEPLPSGETLLWQGAPRWTALARRAFHIRGLALYFAALTVWCAVADTMAAMLWVVPLSLGAIGVLALIAWIIGRTTVYTITTRRLVMRFGAAIPITLNIPFRMIDAAALKTHGDGTGDIVLTLAPGERIAWLVLWPHVRPWRLSRAEPMLRAVPHAADVAATLADALAATTDPARRPASDAARDAVAA
jgi:Bacterial PH domain